MPVSGFGQCVLRHSKLLSRDLYKANMARPVTADPGRRRSRKTIFKHGKRLKVPITNLTAGRDTHNTGVGPKVMNTREFLNCIRRVEFFFFIYIF